jgi:hypothetical protein
MAAVWHSVEAEEVIAALWSSPNGGRPANERRPRLYESKLKRLAEIAQ